MIHIFVILNSNETPTGKNSILGGVNTHERKEGRERKGKERFQENKSE
jgi:hypothetical protein